MIQTIDIILASKSPRRQMLLEGTGLKFSTMSGDSDESFPTEMPVEHVAEFLAIKKMSDFYQQKYFDKIIITADTTVIIEGQILNKPIDFIEAKKMLQLLSGKKHQVITGVCLKFKEEEIRFTDITDVYFVELSDDLIESYINEFKPFDKAGSYGIQEKIGYLGIDKIEGCFYNVMGLPIRKVYNCIEEFQKKINN